MNKKITVINTTPFEFTSSLPPNEFVRSLLEYEGDGEWRNKWSNETIIPTVTIDKVVPTMKEKQLETSFVIAAMVSFTIAVFFCIGSSIFVYHYRKNPVISISQPRFLWLIFGGAALIASSGYFLLFAEIMGDYAKEKVLNGMCATWIWIYNIGINIVYMAIFGKLWRIQRVSQFRRRQNVSVNQTIWPLRVMFFVNLLILSVWTFENPPKYRKLDSEKNNFVLGTCDFVQLPYFVPSQLILLVAVALGLWMAYKTRKLPRELNEGGQIFYIYLCNTVTFFVFVVLYTMGWLLRNLVVMNASVVRVLGQV